MFNKYNDGWIEVITGPMFSGKTAETIKRAMTFVHAKKDFIVFRPNIDTRTDSSFISSRTGVELSAINIEKSSDILGYIKKEIVSVIIDEAQFFDKGIVDVADKLANSGIRVIIAGLELDFKKQSFGPMPELLAKAEFVTKLAAVCFTCGASAAFSKRISGSETKKIEVGDSSYEARCRKCYGE
ncbi:MAG: thymidine kinase [Mycoplasmataceae bacterium]|nr:thymidine kinase [Mycoplasmataceae bacterium]